MTYKNDTDHTHLAPNRLKSSKMIPITHILCLTLLSGCANLEFEDWRETKRRLENGVQFTEEYKARLKGKYIYVQKGKQRSEQSGNWYHRHRS